MAIATPTQHLTLTRTLKAPAAEVYRAFTDRDGLYYWLCDNALVNARLDGPGLLTWSTGFYAFITFTALEPNKQVTMTWRGSGENDASIVEVQLEETRGETALTLIHRDFADNADPETYRKEWENRLRQLASYLATGVDLRITERIIVGIFPGVYNAEVAQRLGVPVNDGTLVGSVLPGLGAEKAGLQANDVIVKVDGQAATSQNPMFKILTGKKPGDVVPVTFYRGAEQHTINLNLSGYPIPELSADFNMLADRTRTLYDQLDKELSDLLNGVSEAAAERKLAPDEWNTKEVLAHLILNERALQNQMGGFFQGPEIGGYTANTTPRIKAVTASYVTLAALVEELRRSWRETVALYRHVPADARKAVLWTSAFNYAGYAQHFQQHLDQIRAALGNA